MPMDIKFEQNEFTTSDLLEYLRRGYGSQISGAGFSIHNINVWVRIGKIADAYGGNKILRVDRYKEFGNIRILTIEHLNRSDIEFAYGAFGRFMETLNKARAKPPKTRKQKLRTEFYYQILGGRGRRSKAIVIPDKYKEVGIRENQFKGRSVPRRRIKH
jgi:hypothetical protein